jgi:hypothetical protein
VGVVRSLDGARDPRHDVGGINPHPVAKAVARACAAALDWLLTKW